ncbi:uncharacterized protein FSUBG_1081 [Fusarium subglutinans]|uniref:Uncharacterized protein n=1 Tax=Gibberella subglutinans TaxID=42677 RepID=A0A8H5QBR2_GIBSU|nr:uncharacterized protein FSUBG_1081 [Fusarium subglutinans]KAF5612851.1 hypothetical protein FSUBG_1081 [Fusarium subglutinans]
MATVGNLQIYYGATDRYEPLPSTSTRFKVAEAVVKLALAILESPEGKESIVKKNPFVHIYREPLEDMGYWVGKFLESVKEDFPLVYISENVAGEAEAERLPWGRELRNYNAAIAGRVFLSKVIIDNMVYAREKHEIAGITYNLFKFQMGISVAHEIIHLLTGFLTGESRPDTPPGVTMDPFGSRDTGEAGRYWEGILLGGIVECWANKNDIMGVRQSGTPYLFETGHSNSNGWRISSTYIESFINGVFSFPIRVSNPAETLTRSSLKRAQSQETSNLRTRRRQRNAPPTASPAPGHSSASIAYRRLPANCEQYPVQTAPVQFYLTQPVNRVPPYSPYSESSSTRSYPPQARSYYPPSSGSSRSYDPYNRR